MLPTAHQGSAASPMITLCPNMEKAQAPLAPIMNYPPLLSWALLTSFTLSSACPGFPVELYVLIRTTHLWAGGDSQCRLLNGISVHKERSSWRGWRLRGIQSAEEKVKLAWALITSRRTPVQKTRRSLSISTQYGEERELA